MIGEQPVPRPRCALHPEHDARRTPCERCGDFVCENGYRSADDEICARCRARVGFDVAWEREREASFFVRLRMTVEELVPRPAETFAGIGRGSIASAAGFAAAINLVCYGLIWLICAPLVMDVVLVGLSSSWPVEGGILALLAVALAAMPLLIAGSCVVHSFVIAVPYHGLAVALGGRASLESSLRAALYLNALAPVSAIVQVVSNLPVVGMLVSVAYFVLWSVWTTVALASHARDQHQLTGAAAFIPALAPVALFVILIGAAVVFIFLAALAGAALEPPTDAF